MSLIDEALRRARQEAARQDAAKRDEAYRHVPVLPPMATRRRSGLSPALIGAAVVLLVVAGVALGMYLGRGNSPEPEPQVAEVSPATPAPAPEPRPQRPVPVVEEAPEPEPAPVPTPGPTPAPVAEAPPTPAPPAPEPEPTPAPAAPAPTPTPEPAPTPAPEVRTYVREVPLPDGGSLRLNGIAFSAAQPVALINDKVLAKGESYQGFLVTDIQANLVELRSDGTIVRVTLK